MYRNRSLKPFYYDTIMKKKSLSLMLALLLLSVISSPIFAQCSGGGGGGGGGHTSSYRSRGYYANYRNPDSSWTELKTMPINAWDDVENYYATGISQRFIQLAKGHKSSQLAVIPTINLKLFGFGQRFSRKFSGNMNFDILIPTSTPNFSDNKRFSVFVGVQAGLDLDYQVFSSNKWRVEAFDNVQVNYTSLHVNTLNTAQKSISWENYLRTIPQKTVDYEEFTAQMSTTDRNYIPLKNSTFTNQTGLELDYRMHSVALGLRVGYNWQFDNEDHYWDYCYQQNKQSQEYFKQIDGPELDLSGVAIGLNLNFLVGKRYSVFHPKS